jgi:hypothetical protein
MPDNGTESMYWAILGAQGSGLKAQARTFE